MPIWFNLLFCGFFFLAPGGLNQYLVFGAKRWHLMLLLPMMALFGFHEQIQLFSTLYLNYGGFLLPAAYFGCLLFFMPKEERKVCLWCVLLGGLGAHMAESALSGWADTYLYSSEVLRGMVMAVYALAFCRVPMQGLCAYVLGFSLSGLIGYADQALFMETAYASLGVDVNHTVLIAGAYLVLGILILWPKALAALRRRKARANA